MKEIKEENYLSIVAVVHNDGERIVEKLSLLHDAISDMFKYYEIIVVDNYSSDQTAEKLEHLGFPITILTLPILHDTQSALTAGIELAIGDYILEIPSLSSDIAFSSIKELYRICQQGSDFVFLTPQKSSLFSNAFYSILNNYFKSSLSETFVSSLMTLSSRRGQNKATDDNNRIVNRNVSYVMSGLKCASVRTEAINRNGRSFTESINLMLDTLIYHTDYIYHLIMKISLTFLGISLLAIAYGLITYFVIKTSAGWASTFILIAWGFCALFGILAIICKYLSDIIKNDKPKAYIFSSVGRTGKRLE